MARYALGSIIASLVIGACAAATTRPAADTATQIVREAPNVRVPPSAEVDFELPAVEMYSPPSTEPVHAVEDKPRNTTEEPFPFTRTIDRDPIDARGATRLQIDAPALRAAVLADNAAWTPEQRRELLVFLRGSLLQKSADFTEADTSIVAKLQAGSGAPIDGVLGDETMALFLAMGFRASARNAKPSEVTLEFFPGELEDLEAWKSEIEKNVIKNGGRFNDLTEPPGEGMIYVRVGKTIVARYRARGGPPSPLEDGEHVALPTTPGTYSLAAGEPHVTSNWYFSQIPWGAEIRAQDGGYQYRSPGQKKWLWATSHPATKLKDPIALRDFKNLPEEMRDGTTYWIWDKNDFGPIAWNLVPSDLYVHTTPAIEAEAAAAGPRQWVSLGLSHGCIHVDPRERDEMMTRGYLGQDIRFVVRRWDEHLLPNEIRREMLGTRASVR